MEEEILDKTMKKFYIDNEDNVDSKGNKLTFGFRLLHNRLPQYVEDEKVIFNNNSKDI